MRRLATLLLATILTVAACGPTNPTPGPSATATPTLSPTATPAPTLSGGLACGEIHYLPPGRLDLCELLDGFWGPVLALSAVPGGRPYEPPAEILRYRSGDVPATICTEGTDAKRWSKRAFYCPADERIAFDEGWFRESEARFGAHAPVAVLAHEWGHHVQEVLGFHAASIRLELQADCLAGLYLASAIPRDDAGQATVGGQELIAGLATFFDLGDDAYRGSGWFDPGVHGSPVQRMLAFGTGVLGFGKGDLAISQGLPWCLGYREFTAGDVVKIGPYRFVQMPGRPGTMEGASYVVRPDASTAIGSSTIILSWIPDFVGGATPANIDLVLEAYGASALFPTDEEGAYLDLSGNLGIGTGIARMYASVTNPDGSVRDESGWMGLIAPASADGALFVLVSRPQGPPTDLNDPVQFAVIEEQTLALYQVINRLCTPDQSGDPAAENLNTVCMADQ